MSNLVSIMFNSTNKGHTVVYSAYSKPHRTGSAKTSANKATVTSTADAGWTYSSGVTWVSSKII